MSNLPTIIILAGGYGTRLNNLTKNTPKSMVEINKKPFIYHQLSLFKKNNLNNVIICTGHLSSQIQDYVGNGEKFGLNVLYSNDGEKLLGTGGAIKKASQNIPESFFVIYGDSYLDICYEDIYEYYKKKNKKPLMTILKNNNNWDKSNIVYKDGKIISYKKEMHDEDMNYIDYGLSIMKNEDFINFKDNEILIYTIYLVH